MFDGGGAPAEREGGSVSLIGLALCVFVVIAVLATVDVGAVVIGRTRAQTAADLAALAAVTPYPVLPSGAAGAPASDAPSVTPRPNPDPPPSNGLGSPIERAARVAAANGGRVMSCTCGPLETTIAVTVRVPLVPLGTSVQVRAYARAVLRQAVGPPGTVARAGFDGASQ
jgi:hypothetical protein